MRLKLRKLNKFFAIFKKFPQVLAEHVFLVSLILFLLAVLLGGLVFYKYGLLVKKKEVEIIQKPATLDEDGLQRILQIWQERQKRFDETELKEYYNPF